MKIKSQSYFVMLNLLGPEEVRVDNLRDYKLSGDENIFVHWYGKNGLRPKRKMGHVTAIAENYFGYVDVLKRLELIDEKWKREMKGLI